MFAEDSGNGKSTCGCVKTSLTPNPFGLKIIEVYFSGE
jgi:hypothetical protein